MHCCGNGRGEVQVDKAPAVIHICGVLDFVRDFGCWGGCRKGRFAHVERLVGRLSMESVGGGRGHTGQVGATTTCSQNKHVGEFLYFKLPKLPVQVKSRAIKDVTKYVLNTDVQFTN